MDSRSNPNPTSADLAEVRALFERQVKAENDHDLAGIASVLAEEQDGEHPRVMFVARIGRFAGREACCAASRAISAVPGPSIPT